MLSATISYFLWLVKNGTLNIAHHTSRACYRMQATYVLTSVVSSNTPEVLSSSRLLTSAYNLAYLLQVSLHWWELLASLDVRRQLLGLLQ